MESNFKSAPVNPICERGEADSRLVEEHVMSQKRQAIHIAKSD
jgi:hypothetical protein